MSVRETFRLTVAGKRGPDLLKKVGLLLASPVYGKLIIIDIMREGDAL